MLAVPALEESLQSCQLPASLMSHLCRVDTEHLVPLTPPSGDDDDDGDAGELEMSEREEDIRELCLYQVCVA